MFTIWHDNDFDLAHWLYLNSDLVSQDVVFRQIPKTNSVADLLRHLTTDTDLAILPAIKYETPDIILARETIDGRSQIDLVIEFMTHTPQHDHPLQRFTRIYGSAWLGVPSILVIPEKKEKLEKGRGNGYKPTVYRANPLIFHLFIKTQQITGTPTLLMLWPESSGYLRFDKQHPTAPRVEGQILDLLQIVNDLVADRDIHAFAAEHAAKQRVESRFDETQGEYRLTSGSVIETSALVDSLADSLAGSLVRQLSSRDKTFLYSPRGLKSAGSNFRTDPYAGKLCSFDLLFCRDESGDRVVNLVLQANRVPSKQSGKDTLTARQHEEESCPFISYVGRQQAERHFADFCPYTMSKQQRIYGEIPDLVVFDDEVTYAPQT